VCFFRGRYLYPPTIVRGPAFSYHSQWRIAGSRMIRRVLMTSAVALVAAFSIRFAAANGQLLTTEFAAELTWGKTLPGHAD